MKDVLFFIIGTVVFLTVSWLVGYFVTLNMLWFYTSAFGRIVAVILFFITIAANVKAMND